MSYFRHAKKAPSIHNTTSHRIGLDKSAKKINNTMADLTLKKAYTPVRIWQTPTAEVSLLQKYHKGQIAPELQIEAKKAVKVSEEDKNHS